MKLTILGSGTAWPNPKRNSPGYHLEFGLQHFLIDCGSGTLHQLAKINTDFNALDGIFLTHFHIDHCGDLPSIMVMLLHSPLLQRTKDFHLYGAVGLKNLWQQYQTVHPDLKKRVGFNIVIHELSPGDAVTLSDGTVTTYPVNHIASSLGLRFTSNTGKIIVFSGDTAYDQKIVTLAKSADIAIFECCWPEEYYEHPDESWKAKYFVDMHLSATLAGKLAQEAQVKKLILSHICPGTDAYPLVERCKAVFNGEVVVAEDLMAFVILGPPQAEPGIHEIVTKT